MGDLTFAESIAQLYVGRKVEVYCGLTSHSMKMAEEDYNCKDVVRGVVVGALGDALMLDCSIGSLITRITINGWGILSVTEFGDVQTKDLFINEQENNKHERLGR